ncbi:acyl-CoA thioesterase [Georgenia sp. Z1491]|uniref:acyl-CoA thioesterase n=1 Tax=Georgenia sp. Z1491 TaxID=3416707 RepID=UPI003CF806D4
MPRLTIPVRLRWSDIDAYRHVNNARMLGILEECRIQAFWASVPGDPAGPPAEAPATSGPTMSALQAAADAPGTKVLATGPGSGTNTYIARQEIEYLAPVPYSLEPLQVELWISHLGGASIDVCYEIPGPDGPAARATTTLVLVDEETGRPRRLTADERSVWSEFMDPPIRFRRRDRDTSDAASATAQDGA